MNQSSHLNNVCGAQEQSRGCTHGEQGQLWGHHAGLSGKGETTGAYGGVVGQVAACREPVRSALPCSHDVPHEVDPLFFF